MTIRFAAIVLILNCSFIDEAEAKRKPVPPLKTAAIVVATTVTMVVSYLTIEKIFESYIHSTLKSIQPVLPFNWPLAFDEACSNACDDLKTEVLMLMCSQVAELLQSPKYECSEHVCSQTNTFKRAIDEIASLKKRATEMFPGRPLPEVIPLSCQHILRD